MNKLIELQTEYKKHKEYNEKIKNLIKDSKKEEQKLKNLVSIYLKEFRQFVVENKNLYEGFNIGANAHLYISSVKLLNGKKAIRLTVKSMEDNEYVVLIPYEFIEDKKKYLKNRTDYIESKNNQHASESLIKMKEELNKKINEVEELNKKINEIENPKN